MTTEAKLIDKMWMLVNDRGIWYAPPGKSAQEAWNNAINWARWDNGGTITSVKTYLKAENYKAKQVYLSVVKS